MSITVETILQLPAFEHAIMLAGEKNISNVVSSLNVMDVPEIVKFVKPGELLVTSTYPIKDSAISHEKLAPDLVESGVSALAIAPLSHDDVVPQCMLDQAEMLDFPLIQLPMDISFNEILNSVLELILAYQNTILRRNHENHKSFIDVILHGGSLHEISQAIYSLHEISSSIHNAHMKLLAWAGLSDERIELADSLRLLRQAIGGKTGHVVCQTDAGNMNVFVHPIVIAEENYGYVILWPQEAQRPTGDELEIIDSASAVIALEMSRLNDMFSVEQKFRSRMFEDLIEGKIQHRTDFIAWGEQYGWNLSLPLLPVAIKIDNLEAMFSSHTDSKAPMVLRKFKDCLHTYAPNIYPDIIIVSLNAGTLMILPIKPPGSEAIVLEKAMQIVEFVQNELSVDFDNVSVSAGVGQLIGDIMELGHAYKQGIKALEIGYMLNGNGAVTKYSELGVYRILSLISENSEALLFRDEILEKLIDSDKNRNTSFLKTLDALHRYNYKLKEAARSLYIHFNTLDYRIKQIEKITGKNLKSPSDRIEIETALKLHQLSNKNNQ